MDYHAYYIDKIHELVNKIDYDCDKSSLAKELAHFATRLQHEIERRHSGIYIAIYDIGPDDNSIRFYTPLGRMTESEALRRLDDLSDDGYDDVVKEITPEEWDDFYHLGYLEDIYNRLDWLNRYEKIDEKFKIDISNKIETLRKKLGLRYRWERVNLK